ncbi:MAG: hypothetical protein LBC04_04910 [Holosporaceae bacterium]|jgi:hypothetical protein|nr:hypothetical protein [Holosporaceae bacterium]
MSGLEYAELAAVFLMGLFLRDLLSCLIKILKSRNDHSTTRRDFSYRNDEKEIHHTRFVGYAFASNDGKDDHDYAATPLQDSSNPTDTA